ncbi:MAG: energy-coupling factor ABC transporter ATP-binding protein [Treponema sp.]|jgi:biotin transport system ATP-binding protein|nr:energy-coupling factor ABC transporter ATP-binding protein [Treponema sp.]
MTDAAETPLFSVRNLVKVFPGPGGTAIPALAGINLDIRREECLLIAGSNGSGKTLLVRMLTGLIEPSGGEILCRGKPLAESGSRAGLVFQDADAQIIGETPEEDAAFGPRNLRFSKDEVERRVRESLTAVGLAEKRGSPARRLSGGEKRRLAIAGVLAMGCETVILDEPFANLDWPGVVQTLQIILGLKRTGKTVIILTHELEKALAFADRLVILDRGVIRDDGRPEEVLNRLKPEYGVRDPRRHYDSAEDCTWLD